MNPDYESLRKDIRELNKKIDSIIIDHEKRISKIESKITIITTVFSVVLSYVIYVKFFA